MSTMANAAASGVTYGPTPAPPLELADMLSVFRRAVSEAATRPALIYFNTSISYAELDGTSDRLAAWLVEQGCGPADRVMINLQNVPQFVMLTVACWKAGCIPVPANPMYRPGELARMIADAEPRVIACFDHQVPDMEEAIGIAGTTSILLATSPYAFQSSDDRRVLPPRASAVCVPLLERIVVAPAVTPLPAFRPDGDDLGLILYTSGTTGRPKGAMLRHASLAFNAQTLRDWCGLSGDSRILAPAPLFHITGFVCHIAVAFSARAAVILHYRVDPALMLDMIRQHRPTFTIGAITVFNAVSNLPGICHADMASFDRVYSGGAPIPPALLDHVESRLGVKIHSCYGMTEATAPTHLAPYMAPIPVDEASGALSIGVLEPGTEARIVDDRGHDVPAGTPGEILLRGPQVMTGYWRNPAETAAALKDGWMHSGDVGFVDERGWYYLVDRIKDVIIASGFKVWPREVEDALYAFDGVREAAVVGVVDAYRGETVKACISLQPGASVDPQDVIAHCRARLAAYKVPRVVEILEELPKTATGKIQRLALRPGA